MLLAFLVGGGVPLPTLVRGDGRGERVVSTLKCPPEKHPAKLSIAVDTFLNFVQNLRGLCAKTSSNLPEDTETSPSGT